MQCSRTCNAMRRAEQDSDFDPRMDRRHAERQVFPSFASAGRRTVAVSVGEGETGFLDHGGELGLGGKALDGLDEVCA